MEQRISTHWLPLLAWMTVIFIFSAIPSSHVETFAWGDFALRKSAHITEYAILAVLIRRLFPEKKSSAAWFLSFTLTVLYAASDEWHQTLVAGRTGALLDVAIDSFGALLGLTIWHKKLRKKKHLGKR